MAVVDPASVVARRRFPKLRIGAVVALAVAAGSASWILVGRSDTSGSPPAPAVASGAPRAVEPRLVSPAELGGVASESAPDYWVGPRSDAAYELTQAGEGRVFVRYLRSASQLGSPRADFIAVATYAQPNAYASIEAAARRPGAITIHPANGGLAVYDRARPTSVFLAYPGGRSQIEVYAPSGATAQGLVRKGAVAAVPLPGAPRIVSPSQLSNFAADREHRIYWAGARRPSVVELTETRDGNVFVRYLRHPSQLGSSNAGFLVVATYARARAYAGLKAAGRRPGAVTMRVKGGGIAVYNRKQPTSVYVAYPGRNRQIEVYAPDARQARKLVRTGAVVPVP
jgi:hypothetical protein